MIEEALHTRLAGFSGLSALVGDRIFPLLAPQGVAVPFVTFQRISGERLRSFDGPLSNAMPRFQIDCYAATYAAAKDVAEQVRLALDGFSGTVGDTQSPERFSPVRFHYVALIDDRDFLEIEMEPRLYRVSADFRIHHNED